MCFFTRVVFVHLAYLNYNYYIKSPLVTVVSGQKTTKWSLGSKDYISPGFSWTTHAGRFLCIYVDLRVAQQWKLLILGFQLCCQYLILSMHMWRSLRLYARFVAFKNRNVGIEHFKKELKLNYFLRVVNAYDWSFQKGDPAEDC